MGNRDTSTRAVATEERREALIALLRIAGPGDECITWPWAKSGGKYARVSGTAGMSTYAHRFVWEEINGPIPVGYEVCHNCPGGDNPTCVRPSHLWLGTHSQNIIDAYAKGRMHGNTGNHARGESHHSARLTAEQVVEIRRRAGAGEVQRRLALEFGITPMGINNIVKRRSWAHVPDAD